MRVEVPVSLPPLRQGNAIKWLSSLIVELFHIYRVWSEVLDALNEARVKAGLPRGGKLISGPTQYGFTNEKLQQCIEKLGGVQRCKKYIMLKDKENPRRTPGKDVSDGALSESDADTDDDEEVWSDYSYPLSHHLVTCSFD